MLNHGHAKKVRYYECDYRHSGDANKAINIMHDNLLHQK
jgi:hypothetical protein